MQNNRFDEPVLQHLVNANCTPCLLYGAEVIEWNKSDLRFNTATFTIYKVNFQYISIVYQFRGQRDLPSEVEHMRLKFLRKCVFTENSVIKLLYECFCVSCI